MKIIEDYKEGKIKVLTNVHVLAEGFDDPEAALCINLRPTLSRVVSKQRGGRVLRLDPNNPLKHAIIVDYLDRDESRRRLQVTFAQVAEGAEILSQVEIDALGRATQQGSDIKSISPQGFVGEKDFDIEGLSVITNAEEVLRLIRELESEVYQPAPVGWFNSYALSKNLSLEDDGRAISGFVNRYRSEHPEWFGFFKGERHVSEYFSPELIEIITENFKSKPEGWVVVSSLRDIGLWKGRQLEFLSRMRREHPEWFGTFLGSNNVIREHLAPELVALARKEVLARRSSGKVKQAVRREVKTIRKEDLTEPIEGWVTNYGVAQESGLDYKTVQYRADKHREEHPEWFRHFVYRGRVYEYYAPGLISIISRKKPETTAPVGWMTKNGISAEIGKDSLTIETRARKYEEDHPEWFSEHVDRTNQVRNYYAPKLIEQIKQDLTRD